jgi:hypothetical protein
MSFSGDLHFLFVFSNKFAHFLLKNIYVFCLTFVFFFTFFLVNQNTMKKYVFVFVISHSKTFVVFSEMRLYEIKQNSVEFI